MERKVERVEQLIDSIEKDIYLENEYDLEIICPYCNYNFLLDSHETSNEVECPECKNIIEIDWDGDLVDDNCHEDCRDCGQNCMNIIKEDEKLKDDNKGNIQEDDDI